MRHTNVRKLGRRAVVIPASVALVLGGGALALAAVSPAPQVAVNGNGGYDSVTAAATGFSQVQTVVTPTQYGTTVKTGAQGVQLCSSASNAALQLGLTSTNTSPTYSVAFARGTLPAPGCPTAGVLAGAAVLNPGLSAVPFGHAVWTSVTYATKTVTHQVLVCIISGLAPVPTPTMTPTVTPTMPAATAPATMPPATMPPTTMPPTTTPTKLAALIRPQLISPTVVPTGGAGPTSPPLIRHSHGSIRCHVATITLTRNEALFEAQDLNALGTATDAAGVFTQVVHLTGTPNVYNHADAGVNEDATGLVPCAPVVLAGPAAYTSEACQPVGTFEFTQAKVGAVQSDLSMLATTEGISPSATAALVAPNNSITQVNTGPHGSATDAVAAGDHFEMFTANAPTT